jgi:hypothetical protein
MAASVPPERRDPSPAPSFEFEDGTPATPAKPDTGSAPAPAFNPFADKKVQVPIGSATTPLVPPPPAAPGDVVPPSANASEMVAEDAAASKDLWYCPHCGSGNQKKRDLCRACGKDPLTPVTQPWFRTMPGMAGIGVAVAILIIGSCSMIRTDKSFHAPGPEAIDCKERTWGGFSDSEVDLGDNHAFTKRGKLSVSGRVLACTHLPGYPWITSLVLALGDEAREDVQFNSWTAAITDNGTTSTAPRYVALHCYFEDKVAFPAGTWLSLMGDTGSLTDNASLVPFTTQPGQYSVRVERFEVQTEDR